MKAYAEAQGVYENNSLEKYAYSFDHKFAAELVEKLPPFEYGYEHYTPSWNKRSRIVLPEKLPENAASNIATSSIGTGNSSSINTTSINNFDNDFNGDGKTDIFTVASGGNWNISYGGASKWQKINRSSNPITDFSFGGLNNI